MSRKSHELRWKEKFADVQETYLKLYKIFVESAMKYGGGIGPLGGRDRKKSYRSDF
jgi:hypothetical protein